MSEDLPESDGQVADTVLELNFVPAWARKPPSSNFYETSGEEAERPFRDHRPRGDHGDRDRRRGPSAGGREDRGRPARGAARPGRPRREGERREGPGQGQADEPRRDGSPRGQRQEAPLPPVDVSFFPDRRQLSALVRQIHSSRKAYPLLDVASLLMAKPEFCHVKIEADRGENGVDIHLCGICRMAALDNTLILSHAFREHAEEFFTIEETELPEPAGQFACVARCGLSGVLLGPPNHHSYAERVQEIHSTRFAHLSLDEYRRSIETVRDEAMVAQWKAEVRKQRLYRVKKGGEPDIAPMTRYRAEQYFREHLSASVASATRRAVLPATVAQRIEDRDLRAAVRVAWQREQRFPRSVLFALRAALKHMHLHVFRAGRGTNFVTHTRPLPLDPKFAVEAIAEVLRYLREHPGSSRKEMVDALRPGEGEKEDGARDILSPLGWLIEKGHIIEFFNGTLAVPLDGDAPRAE